MRGLSQTLTIGERIAWCRRRRGMTQEVLAGTVGRTVDWLSKVENNKIDLDRLSVIRAVAEALDVTLGDLIGEPSLLEWTKDSGRRTVPALRDALLDYRQVSPFLTGLETAEPVSLATLRRDVAGLWDAYDDSRYGYVVGRLPLVLADAQAAVTHGTEGDEAYVQLALTYRLATTLLTKLGEPDLAWIAAERGLGAAQHVGDPAIVGTLHRSIVHALVATGRYETAVQLTRDAADYLEPGLINASPTYLSVTGTLYLVGGLAAARAEDRTNAQAFISEADHLARRLGGDTNHLWTAFGPTNVAIHRVASAMALGDVQVAIDLGPRIDTSGMTVERRARHALEVARAYSKWNRIDDALGALLDAEQLAPELVRYHSISRQLVQSWIKRGRGKPSYQLADLARRLRVLDGAAS